MERERNLLFGVFAVQLRKATPAQVMEAAAAWAIDPSNDLPQRLIDAGAISQRDREAIETFVAEAVALHNGDIAATLQTFGEVRVNYVQLEQHATRVTLSPLTGPTALMSPDSSPGIELPRVLEAPGRYSLKSEHARGGQGRLLLVHDEQLGRDIILKELLPGAAVDTGTPTPIRQSAGLLYRFIQEAKITGQLEHPSIVPVYELGIRPDGSPYYTMKLVKGVTLSEALKSAKTLEDRLVYLQNFVGMCHGIAYAHSRGIIHRDLKPNNVMVGQFGETVILDWGLAKVKGRPDIHSEAMTRTMSRMKLGEDIHLTDPGVVLGTPAYMAPEQARGEIDSVDERSDIYSLGVVLYQLITGDTPFKGSTARAVLERVANERPDPVLDREPNAPAALAAICQRCLALEPKRRYQSARELAEDVQRFMSGALVKAHTYKLSEIARHYYRKYRAELNIAAAAALLLVGFGIYSFVRISQARDAAIEARDIAQSEAYLSQIRLASNAVEDMNDKLANTTLASTFPGLRNWEWGYLTNCANRDIFRLEDRVDAVFSPDGSRLAASSKTLPTAIFSGLDGQQIVAFDSGNINSRRMMLLAFSPDGTKLSGADATHVLTVWDATTGTLIRELFAYQENVVIDIQFDRTGDRVLAASMDGTVRVFDVATGAKSLEFTDPDALVISARYSPDARYIVTVSRTGGVDNQTSHIDIRDAETGAIQQTIPGGVYALNADGSVIAVVDNNTIGVYDTASGAVKSRATVEAARIGHIAFLAGGRRLLASTIHSGLIQVDVETGNVVKQASTSVACDKLHVSADGRIAMVVSRGGDIATWNVQSMTPLLTFRSHTMDITASGLSPDGTKMFTASRNGTLKLWSTTTLPGQRIVPGDARWGGIALAADGRKAAVLTSDRLCEVVDADTGISTAAFARGIRYSPAGGVALSADGARLALAMGPTTLLVWDIAGSELLATLRVESGAVVSFAFNPDASQLAVGQYDGIVGVWDVASGEMVRTLEGHAGPATAVAWHPKSAELASGSEDKTVATWDVAAGTRKHSFTGHDGAVNALAFKPNSSVLVSVSADQTARVWDTAAGTEIRVLQAHTQPVRYVGFDSSGTRMFTIAGENVKVWSEESGDELVSLQYGHASPVGLSDGVMVGEQLKLAAYRNITSYVALPWSGAGGDGNSSASLRERVSAYFLQQPAMAAAISQPDNLSVSIPTTPEALRQALTDLASALQQRTSTAADQPLIVDETQRAILAPLFIEHGDALLRVGDVAPLQPDAPARLASLAGRIALGAPTPDLALRRGDRAMTFRFVLIERVQRTAQKTVSRADAERFLTQNYDLLRTRAERTANVNHDMEREYFGYAAEGENINGLWLVYDPSGVDTYGPLGLMGLDRLRAIDGEPVVSVGQLQAKIRQVLDDVRAGRKTTLNVEVDRGPFDTVTVVVTIV